MIVQHLYRNQAFLCVKQEHVRLNFKYFIVRCVIYNYYTLSLLLFTINIKWFKFEHNVYVEKSNFAGDKDQMIHRCLMLFKLYAVNRPITMRLVIT